MLIWRLLKRYEFTIGIEACWITLVKEHSYDHARTLTLPFSDAYYYQEVFLLLQFCKYSNVSFNFHLFVELVIIQLLCKSFGEAWKWETNFTSLDCFDWKQHVSSPFDYIFLSSSLSLSLSLSFTLSLSSSCYHSNLISYPHTHHLAHI